MKKLILAVALFASAPVFAQWHHHHHNNYYGGGYRGSWVAPALIGGIIGYELSRPRYETPQVQQPIIVQQPPVVYQQPSVIYQTQQNCTVWSETMQSDGTITRTRTCTQ